MKKDPADAIVLSKEEQGELLRELIQGNKKDLMSAMVQESMYQYEYVKPTHMGKDKAAEGLGIYQKRIRYLKENIYALQTYAINHEIKL